MRKVINKLLKWLGTPYFIGKIVLKEPPSFSFDDDEITVQFEEE